MMIRWAMGMEDAVRMMVLEEAVGLWKERLAGIKGGALVALAGWRPSLAQRDKGVAWKEKRLLLPRFCFLDEVL